jgi:hypothetical protein
MKVISECILDSIAYKLLGFVLRYKKYEDITISLKRRRISMEVRGVQNSGLQPAQSISGAAKVSDSKEKKAD